MINFVIDLKINFVIDLEIDFVIDLKIDGARSIFEYDIDNQKNDIDI